MRALLQPKRDDEHWLYSRLRDWPDSDSEERRQFFSALWAQYVSFAPKGFEKKLQFEFHQRWWEMYLAVALLRLGFTLKKNRADVGPDISLEVEGQKVFVEATAPSIGRSSDRVPDPVHNGVANFPERECLLRLTQALTEKNARFRAYVDAGTVPHDACMIVALSATDLNQFGTLLDVVHGHPAPLSVLAGAGPTVVTKGGKKPPCSSRRDTLVRDSGSPVGTTLFESPEFSIMSGILYSPADLWNALLDPGDSLSLFLNPSASARIPKALQERFVRWSRERPEGNDIVWNKSLPAPGYVR
jgi:hypothetical protein